MVSGGENHQAVFIEIKIANRRCRNLLFKKFGHALSADACPVLQFLWDPRKQLLWNRNGGAPASTFMAGGATELAIIRAVTKRAELRRHVRPSAGVILLLKRSLRQLPPVLMSRVQARPRWHQFAFARSAHQFAESSRSANPRYCPPHRVPRTNQSLFHQQSHRKASECH